MKNQNPFQVMLIKCLEKDKEGTSGAGVGRQIGKSQQTISAIVKGTRNGSEETRRAIADFFGYPYEDFLREGRKLLGLPVELSTTALYDMILKLQDEIKTLKRQVKKLSK